MQYLETTRNAGAIIFGRLYFVHKSLQSPFSPTVAPFVCVCVFVCVCFNADMLVKIRILKYADNME